MHTGWLLYQDAIDEHGDDYEDQFYWFWFDSKGIKKTNGTKKINGKTYAFDANGAMEKEWAMATISDESTWGWFNAAEDGHLSKKSWIWASEDKILGDDNKDDNRWWYADKHGYLTKDCTKKINGKWYAFDDLGRMKWGLVWLSTESVKDSEAYPVAWGDPADISSTEVYNTTTAGKYLHFFSNDEEKDGSMKTGYNIKIELFDDDFTFGFDKNSGNAYDGVVKNKLYAKGILQKADDNRYEAVAYNGEKYLVSGNGTVMKASQSRTYKDADDVYWFVSEDGELYYASTAAAAKLGENGAKDKEKNECHLWVPKKEIDE
jgi:hypothetical protein